MIKINLTPLNELESQFWYVPDIAVLLASLAIGYFVVNGILDSKRDEIAQLDTEIATYEADIATIAPNVQRYKTIEADIAGLNSKLTAVKQIALSRIERYKPVIVLEHMQNLRPAGLWFSNLEIDVTTNDADSVIVEGHAFDHLLIAEFMTNIKSTFLTQEDPSDLRTQLKFKSVDLVETKMENDPLFGDLKNVYYFKFKIKYEARDLEIANVQPMVSFFAPLNYKINF